MPNIDVRIHVNSRKARSESANRDFLKKKKTYPRKNLDLAKNFDLGRTT